jgi:hypothetical protein
MILVKGYFLWFQVNQRSAQTSEKGTRPKMEDAIININIKEPKHKHIW